MFILGYDVNLILVLAPVSLKSIQIQIHSGVFDHMPNLKQLWKD